MVKWSRCVCTGTEHLCIKQILTDLRGEIDSNTIVVKDDNTLSSTINKSLRQKVSKETLELKYALDQISQWHLCSISHPTAADYTFLSNISRTFSRIDHIIGHKTNLNKLRNINIISSIFPNTMV